MVEELMEMQVITIRIHTSHGQGGTQSGPGSSIKFVGGFGYGGNGDTSNTMQSGGGGGFYGGGGGYWSAGRRRRLRLYWRSTIIQTYKWNNIFTFYNSRTKIR